MNIALLNEFVLFQKSKVETDDIGNHINSWGDYYNCRCTISGESGTETDNAGQTVEHPGMAVTVRWCKKADAISMTGYRIIFRDEIYDIVGIDHASFKRKYLKFRCRKEKRSG